jgi:hypothetical protein
MNSCLKYSAIVVTALAFNGCRSAAISEGDPLWKIPILSKNNCNSIEGKYFDKGLLETQFVDSSMFPGKSKYSYGVSYRKSPYEGLPHKEFHEVLRKFNENAVTQVRKVAEGWEVSLFGGDGVLYGKNIVLIEHQNVGCEIGGNLVLRKFSLIQGGEGSAGNAYASEVMFRKLNDGTLQVQRLSREWVSTMRRPPQSETRTTLSFAPAP